MSEPVVNPEFSRPVNVERLPTGGRHFILSATEDECQSLARRFGLVALSSFKVKIHLVPVAAGDLLHAKGEFSAEITQICGVSLQGFKSSLAESFELSYTFAPADPCSPEVSFDPQGDDPPESVIDGMVDLGEISAEYLGLAVDPFPRAEGAKLVAPPGIGLNEPDRGSPFLVLGGVSAGKK